MIRKYLIVLYILVLLILATPVLSFSLPPSWHQDRVFQVHIIDGIWYKHMKVVDITGYNGDTVVEFKNLDNGIITIVPMRNITRMVVVEEVRKSEEIE